MSKYINLRMVYVKGLLKIYNSTKNTLPKLSNKLKKHIENVSLKSAKLIHEKVDKL